MNLLKISIFLLFMNTANAATISLVSESNSYAISDVFSVDLIAIGMAENGGASLGIDFDPLVLSLNSVVLIADAPFDFLALTGNTVDIFAPLNKNALGDFSIFTMNFSAIAEGVSNISIIDNADSRLAWFDAFMFDPIVDIVYENLSVTVSAIPLPAAIWLFLSGLGLMGFVFKKKI